MTKKKAPSNEYLIREAVSADLPVLVDFLAKLALHVTGGLEQSLKKAEHRRLTEFLSTSLENRDKLIVVAETPEAGLVGMGYIAIIRSQGVWEQLGDQEFKSGIIDDIWVEPEWRKSGIFSAMLRELLAFAEEHGVHELVLEYSVSNKEAAKVWGKLGFKPTGVRAAAFTATVKEALANRQ